MDTKIEKIEAKKIFDSRGEPTLEVSVHAGGFAGVFQAPSGKSKGIHEVGSIDPDEAINLIPEIETALLGTSVFDQSLIDRKLVELDGTANKSRLGGNTLLGVSVAVLTVAAKARGEEIFEYLRGISNLESYGKIPHLYVNLVNGGAHAKSPLAFQEYHIVPDTDNVRVALEAAKVVQDKLRDLVSEEFGDTKTGDEGGFVLNTANVEKPLILIKQAIANANLDTKIGLSLDVAASSFYEDSGYEVGGKKYLREELINIYKELVSKHGIFSIEDPLDEEDFEGFKNFKDITGIRAVGDDLTVTNAERIRKAADSGSIDTVIIKPNQIGTVSETLEAIRVAKERSIDCIVSHRSGETKDTFIADLAWAFGCEGLKAGAPSQEERRVKYERLCKIQEHK